MSSKEDRQLAYEAGRRANSEPPERRTPAANPFPPGSDEAGEWLRGFQEALNEAAPPADLEVQIRDALKVHDELR